MKVLFLLQQGFNDNEFSDISSVLKSNGIGFEIASVEKGKVTGKFGRCVIVTLEVRKVDVTIINSIVIIGGENISTLLYDSDVNSLINSMNEKGRVFCLLCMASVLLVAKHKFLQGKRLSVFSTKDGWSEKEIRKHAKLSYKDVTVDENIITCGQESQAKKAGEELVKKLKFF